MTTSVYEMKDQSIESVKKLDLYKEAVAAIIQRVTELKFIPFWSNDEYDGLRFTTATEGMTVMEGERASVWASPESTRSVDSMAESIICLADREKWVKKIQAFVFGRGLDSVDSMVKLRFTNTLSKALMEECLEKSAAKWIANGFLVQAKKAIADGTVLKHNRQFHEGKLYCPLRNAMWAGLTIEEITKLAKSIKAEMKPKKPTLEEALAMITKPKGGS